MTTRRKTGDAGSISREGMNDSVPSVVVGYAGSEKSYPVKIVADWMRGDIKMVMSASSGPKDYVKNMIAMAFDTKPEIERIRMVISHHNVPFCLFMVRENWFDCSGKQVVWK